MGFSSARFTFSVGKFSDAISFAGFPGFPVLSIRPKKVFDVSFPLDESVGARVY